MIGEFLTGITDIQFLVFVLVYTALLIFLAYKKPNWYKAAAIIFASFILFGIVYTMGWNASMEYSVPEFRNRTLIDNHFSGSPNFTLLFHFFWLSKVYQKRLDAIEDEIGIEE